MKITYQPKKFNPEAIEIIENCVAIIDRYSAQGYTLTLRQLYYQCIASENLPESWRDPVTNSKNNERSYKKLGGLIADARMAGLIDWDMIEDRGRSTSRPSHWDSPRELLEAAARAFSRDKWRLQPNYVEVMVEKQALEGVLEPVCRRLGIPFTSNKGYSSATAMFDAGIRMKEQFMQRALAGGFIKDAETRHPLKELIVGDDDFVPDVLAPRDSSEGRPMFSLTKKAVRDGWPRVAVIYFGDHDPSGIDMTRDVAERLSLFSDMTPLEVHRVALNMDQIEELNPPENPAKETDSRAGSYVAKFGNSSWELDAVSPSALAAMVEEKILEFRDEKIWAKTVKEEKVLRDQAIKAIASLP